MSAPRGSSRFSVMPRLFRFVSRKNRLFSGWASPPEKGGMLRPHSPPAGSTLKTSAPKSPRSFSERGPAIPWLTSRTRRSSSAAGIIGRVTPPAATAPPPGASGQSIGPARRAAEQRQLLVGGGAGGDALERIPHRCVAGAHLLHGKVALEHAAVRSEELDARPHVGPPVGREPGRGRRRLHGLVAERRQPHQHTAELQGAVEGKSVDL